MKITAVYLLLTFITFPPELNLRMATEKCKTVIRVVLIALICLVGIQTQTAKSIELSLKLSD